MALLLYIAVGRDVVGPTQSAVAGLALNQGGPHSKQRLEKRDPGRKIKTVLSSSSMRAARNCEKQRSPLQSAYDMRDAVFSTRTLLEFQEFVGRLSDTQRREQDTTHFRHHCSGKLLQKFTET